MQTKERAGMCKSSRESALFMGQLTERGARACCCRPSLRVAADCRSSVGVGVGVGACICVSVGALAPSPLSLERSVSRPSVWRACKRCAPAGVRVSREKEKEERRGSASH
jgi:hypothetical protein